MKIKLLRSVLVEDADVTPTRDGTVLDMDDTKAREFITLGLASEVAPPAPLPAPVLSPAPAPVAPEIVSPPPAQVLADTPAPAAKKAAEPRNKQAPELANKSN